MEIANAVFDFAFAEIVQKRMPSRIVFKVFGDMTWKEECDRHRRNPSRAARC